MGLKFSFSTSSLANTYLFSLILTIGYAFGCLSRQIHLKPYHPTSKRSTSIIRNNLYPCLFLITINFLTIHTYLLTSFPTRGVPTSSMILFQMIVYVLYISDACRRIFFIIRISKFAKILNQIVSESRNNLCRKTGFKTILYYLITIDFIAGAFRSICTYTIYFIIPIKRHANESAFDTYIFNKSAWEDYSENLGEFILQFGSCSSKIVARAFIFVLSDYFLDKYIEFLAEFKELAKDFWEEKPEEQKFNKMAGQVEMTCLEEFIESQVWTISHVAKIKINNHAGNTANVNAETWKLLIKKFQKLQRSFKTFDLTCGFLIIVCVIESTLCVVYNMHRLSQELRGNNSSMWIINAICGSIDQILNLFLTSLVGQRFKSAMMNGKADIKAFLFRISLDGFSNSQQYIMEHNINPLAEAIINWKWKLTACGLFNVDFGLLPAVAATCMTYIMFIFQVKISEETSGLKQWNGSTTYVSGT